MAKRWEKIDLFGVDFELDTKNTIGYQPIGQETVEDVYGRPSQRKIAIFEDWKRWFELCNGWCGVASHNCNFFTIEGYVRDFNTREMWYCRITPRHNYAVKVDEALI